MTPSQLRRAKAHLRTAELRPNGLKSPSTPSRFVLTSRDAEHIDATEVVLYRFPKSGLSGAKLKQLERLADEGRLRTQGGAYRFPSDIEAKPQRPKVITLTQPGKSEMVKSVSYNERTRTRRIELKSRLYR